MKIIVLKFGGTSVGTTDRIKKVAKIIAKYKKKYKVIVLSSAMSGVTNNLINLSKKISKNFSDSEYDVLVSSGEQVSCALISGELINKGFNSRSWMSWQIPISTEGKYKFSRINKINKSQIISYLKKGGIPIITGFQGINNKNRITTIGRGGTDASAIMFAKFFNAEKCIIYTDVDGVYSTDPNKLKSAKKIKVISYEEMLEMSSTGAKVLQTRSVELAMKNNLTLQVLSSFTNQKGTYVVNENELIENEILKYKTFYKCPNFKIENILCGKSRPNYFPGVKNIVIKLFDIVQADNSFFGEKDYQQLVVIKKLRDELNFGTKIIVTTVENTHFMNEIRLSEKPLI